MENLQLIMYNEEKDSFARCACSECRLALNEYMRRQTAFLYTYICGAAAFSLVAARRHFKVALATEENP